MQECSYDSTCSTTRNVPLVPTSMPTFGTTMQCLTGLWGLIVSVSNASSHVLCFFPTALHWWWNPWFGTRTQFSSGRWWERMFLPKVKTPSVQHAPTIWPKTQEDPEVYCFKQELPCHSDPAAQWRVCWVHALSGEHRAGMFGGSCTETWVKRGMCVFSGHTSGDCSKLYAFCTLTSFPRSISSVLFKVDLPWQDYQALLTPLKIVAKYKVRSLGIWAGARLPIFLFI